MINFIPPFIFSVATWLLYSEVPGVNPAPFSQESFLSFIGVIKYGPPLVLSIFAGYIVQSRITKRFVILLTASCSFLLFLSALIPSESISALIAVFVIAMTSIIYEPILEVLCAYYGEKTGNYLAVNNAMNLARTCARMIAPLLLLYVLKKYFSFSIQITSGIFVIFASAFFLFVHFPEDMAPEDKASNVQPRFFESLKKVFSNPNAYQILIVYSTFYLAVNYLEYFVTIIKPGSTIKLGHLFSILGAGFVTSNLLTLVFKKHLNIKPVHLGYSLFFTGIGLILLTIVPGKMIVLCPFFIGLGNGLSVPLGSAIIQKSLERKDIAVFFGALETSINICGIISMTIGALVFKLLGASTVFIVDGVIIIVSGIYWVIVSNRGARGKT